MSCNHQPSQPAQIDLFSFRFMEENRRNLSVLSQEPNTKKRRCEWDAKVGGSCRGVLIRETAEIFQKWFLKSGRNRQKWFLKSGRNRLWATARPCRSRTRPRPCRSEAFPPRLTNLPGQWLQCHANGSPLSCDDPSSLNSQPSTLNPQPSTLYLNPQPSTLNPQTSTP